MNSSNGPECGLEGSSGGRSRPCLQQLTGDSDRFCAELWHQNAHQHRASHDVSSVLDLDDFDSLVTERGARRPMVWIMGSGEQREPAQLGTTHDGTKMVEGLVVPEDVAAALAAGRTVSLRGLNHFWPPLGSLCRRLELDLMHPVASNAYLTPPGTAGLALHHDPHDVFVVQTHGEKVWEVYRPRIPNPAAPWDPSTDAPGELVGEFILASGDCLYIPLGFPHRARTRDQPSLHVTLGVDVRRWTDALQTLCMLAPTVSAFREPLDLDFPLDPARFRERLLSRLQLLALWAADASLTEPILDQLWSRRRPPLDGHLADVLAMRAIGDDTVVAWRRDHVWRLDESDGELVLRLWDLQLGLPSRCASALQLLSRSEAVRVGDLDGGLDAQERADLVRRLISVGVVRVSRETSERRPDA